MKNWIRRFTMLLITVSFAFIAMTGCSKKDDVGFQIATLKGPTGMGMVKLMDEVKNAKSALKAEFEIYESPDEITGKVISGELELACVPANLASVLYNKTEGAVQIAAVNTLGVLYIVETGDTVKSIEDLRGKKLWATGLGSSPEYILKYILESKGIDVEKDIELEFSMQHAELAAAVASGDAPLAMLPQPYVTTVLMKNEKALISLDINDLWKEASQQSELTMGCIIVNTKFADGHKSTVSKFLNEYKTSVQWVNENTDDAGALIEEYGILPDAKIAVKALPYCSIVYRDAKESREDLGKYFQILFDYNPKSIGGKMPGEDFYFEK